MSSVETDKIRPILAVLTDEIRPILAVSLVLILMKSDPSWLAQSIVSDGNEFPFC